MKNWGTTGTPENIGDFPSVLNWTKNHTGRGDRLTQINLQSFIYVFIFKPEKCT